MWEENVGELVSDGSCELRNVVVREYRGVKYLSICEGSDIREINDIGDVMSDEEQDEERNTIEKEIILVQAIDTQLV